MREHRVIDDELLQKWERGPTVDDAKVSAFEQRRGIDLPADYREFLLKVNGGRAPRERSVFNDGIADLYLALGHEDDSYDIESRISATWGRPPHDDLMLIAYDAGAAPIFLCIRGEHFGEVWWMNTSNLQPPTSRTPWFRRKDMAMLGTSFVEFLRSLTSYDDIRTKS